MHEGSWAKHLGPDSRGVETCATAGGRPLRGVSCAEKPANSVVGLVHVGQVAMGKVPLAVTCQSASS